MRTVMQSEYNKVVIIPVTEDTVMVHFYELMGNRWVELGPAERYDKELADEEF